MADYSPPIENIPIFNTDVFLSGDEPLTYNQAKKKFLKYPFAQGTENLQTINVNGIATFNSTVNMNKTLTMTGTLANDRKINNTYYNMVDAITNATNGSIYSNNDIYIYDNNANSGAHQWAVNSSTGVQSFPLVFNSDYLNILTVQGSTIENPFNNSQSNYTLQIKDTSSNNKIGFIPYSNIGWYSPMTQISDSLIIAESQYLTISTFSPTSCGLRLGGNILTLGAGGTNFNPLNNIIFNGSTATTTLTGPTLSITNTNVNLSSTTPPTSSQTIPIASDASTKIPTTQWVQNAINAKIPSIPFTPTFRNYTDIQTGSGSGYSNGPLLTFGGSWDINDIVYFRITSQMSYNKDGGGAYQNTGNTSGTLYFRPYYFFPNFAPVSSYGGPLVYYTSNTPSSICSADRAICFYSPSYNIGNIGYFYLNGGSGNTGIGGSVRLSCLSPQVNGGWEFFVSVEYIGIRSVNGTVSLSNGVDSSGINNQLK